MFSTSFPPCMLGALHDEQRGSLSLSGSLEGHDPGAMFDLVAHVPGLVVGHAVVPHLPEDLEPPLAQAPQGRGVALALLSLVLVVGLGPGALVPAVVAQELVEWRCSATDRVQKDVVARDLVRTRSSASERVSNAWTRL